MSVWQPTKKHTTLSVQKALFMKTIYISNVLQHHVRTFFAHLKLLKSIFNLILGCVVVGFVWLVVFTTVLAWFDRTAPSSRCFSSGELAMIVLNGCGYFGPMLSSFWNANSWRLRENCVAADNDDESSKRSTRRGRNRDKISVPWAENLKNSCCIFKYRWYALLLIVTFVKDTVFPRI